jgi:hypothetical protein
MLENIGVSACSAPLDLTVASEGDREEEKESVAMTGPGEPIPAYPAANGSVVCRSCGQENPVGSDQCSRPTCRRTLRANTLSRLHGLSAMYLTPALQDIEVEGEALFKQSVVDAGGPVDATGLSRAEYRELVLKANGPIDARGFTRHEYRSLLHIRIRKLALALDVHGDFDKRGRLRGAWIDRLDHLINSAVNLDKTLGLSRQAKDVSLQDYLSKQAAFVAAKLPPFRGSAPRRARHDER